MLYALSVVETENYTDVTINDYIGLLISITIYHNMVLSMLITYINQAHNM